MVEKILEIAKTTMTKERFFHTISVRDFALILARIHGIDPRKLEIAALSHDLFRDVPPRKLLKLSEIWNLEMEDVERRHPILLHGKVAAEFLKRRFEFTDKSVLLAVSYHTSGHPDMDEIGMALVISDTVGFDRDFPSAEKLREIAYRDFKKAFVEILKNRMVYALSTNRYLLPKSVETWNSVVEVIG